MPDLEVMGFDKNKFDIPQKSLIGELQEDGSKNPPSIQVNNPAVSEIPKLEFPILTFQRNVMASVYSSPIALSVEQRKYWCSKCCSINSSNPFQSITKLTTSLNNKFYLTGANLTLMMHLRPLSKHVI